MIVNIEYTQASTAWPRDIWTSDPACHEDLTVGVYRDGEATIGEFRIEWHELDLSNRDKVYPRIVAWDDSWQALSLVLPVLLPLDNPTPADVIDALERIGARASEYHGQLARAET